MNINEAIFAWNNAVTAGIMYESLVDSFTHTRLQEIEIQISS